MNRDVIVKLNGKFDMAQGADGTSDIEVTTAGEYYERKGNEYIMYEEIEADFKEPVKNLLKISKDKISLRKRGLIVADMVFEIGVLHQTHYCTPFGSVVMGINATGIDVKKTDSKITISLVYSMEMDYSKLSDCHITIEINEQKGQTIEEY